VKRELQPAAAAGIKLTKMGAGHVIVMTSLLALSAAQNNTGGLSTVCHDLLVLQGHFSTTASIFSPCPMHAHCTVYTMSQ